MSDTVVQVVRRVLLPVTLLLAVMVLLGVLVTRVLDRTWPFTVEDAVNRELAADRTAGWNDVSLVFSTLASTQVIVLVTVLVALVAAAAGCTAGGSRCSCAPRSPPRRWCSC